MMLCLLIGVSDDVSVSVWRGQGGKSPTVIDDSAVDLQLAAKRILSGKCLNMGQTCISPDYVFCHEKVYHPRAVLP